MALPSPLLVQLPQVMSFSGPKALPSACVPVRMSCWFTVLNRLGEIFAPSERPVSGPILLLAECRSATLAAICTPLALTHGPLPMRSLAFTAVAPFTALVLRYARQVLPPAPTFAARV